MKRWKAVLGVVAVFVFGMVTGALGMIVVGKKISDHAKNDPEFGNRMIVRKLTHDIKLDAAQQKRCAEIVSRAHAKIEEIQQSVKPDIGTVFMEAALEFRGELRPDQQQKFDEWLAKEQGKNNLKRR